MPISPPRARTHISCFVQERALRLGSENNASVLGASYNTKNESDKISLENEKKESYRRPRFAGVGGSHDRISDDSVILYRQLHNNTREELAWRLARESRSEINPI